MEDRGSEIEIWKHPSWKRYSGVRTSVLLPDQHELPPLVSYSAKVDQTANGDELEFMCMTKARQFIFLGLLSSERSI